MLVSTNLLAQGELAAVVALAVMLPLIFGLIVWHYLHQLGCWHENDPVQKLHELPVSFDKLQEPTRPAADPNHRESEQSE